MPSSTFLDTASLSPFVQRHIGPSEQDQQDMLARMGLQSLEQFIDAIVPNSIRTDETYGFNEQDCGITEDAALSQLAAIAAKNKVFKNYIGQGYYGTHTPKVIQRNVLENPAWYTAYTPYQPEISQGRLELLYYYQTLVSELTGLEVANASLLDEATAAAEAMTLCLRQTKKKGRRFLVAADCHPQTIEVVMTRAQPLAIDVIQVESFADYLSDDTLWNEAFGMLIQYPNTAGRIGPDASRNIVWRDVFEAAKKKGIYTAVATDLLALCLLKSPRELGADIALGSSQRFGVPLGFGGPHAAFFAVSKEFQRSIPGRIVGESIDRYGRKAYRLALQTREQHIRREKATSNICTAQALLAMMATLYAIYHGPEGLRTIALRIARYSSLLAEGLRRLDFEIRHDHFFDTIAIETGKMTESIMQRAVMKQMNLRRLSSTVITVSFDETTTDDDVANLIDIFDIDGVNIENESSDRWNESSADFLDPWLRSDLFLSQRVFHAFHSETEMMRYLRRLSEKDIALDRAMIPLGSCTMKLNAASELTPITWPAWNAIHPFAPNEQAEGYRILVAELEAMLCEITGYDAISLQPNAGSQGEYAGLLAIQRFHQANGNSQRTICLIPSSAHGTNPASAQMANMTVVVVACDLQGNVDLADLRKKLEIYGNQIAAIMITYPSTHGVFEEDVQKICDMVHDAGGQVYIDGANLNALVEIAKPGKFGGDVSHLNLHKTFCIPHGGGGPGIGPVAVKSHLATFLPRDPWDASRQGSLISAATCGSASLLPISWMYIKMMGRRGLQRATQVAMLNANYIAHELKDIYPILYTGRKGFVAHECILDMRNFEKEAGVTIEDFAKRLIDFGFHSPTMSFPVPGTLMIEPTESESKEELDRFCDAMRTIHGEYLRVKSGEWTVENNPLRNSPHTIHSILDESMIAPYSRKTAIDPSGRCEDPDFVKYWPPVGRVDNVYGDRNLVCSCPPVSAYEG